MSEAKMLVGKTIKFIDTSADNVWKIVFTDGTQTQFWAESLGVFNIPFLDVIVNGENITGGPNR